MRTTASSVSRLQKDIERLKHEIADLETDLAASGSTKTADDVQEELDKVSADLWVTASFSSLPIFADD